MGIKNGIHIEGLDKLIKDIQTFGEDGEQMVAEITEGNAREIEATAKQIAPYDLGTLRQEIRSYTSIESRGTFWKIEANANGRAPYSAYQEFGTGGLVDIPPELAEMAINFKGKGVKKINLPARPFLYPAFVIGREQYYQDLKDGLNDLTNKI